MVDPIPVEVTPSIRRQYDELVEQHGEAEVQAALLQSIIPIIRDSHNGVDN